MSTPGRCAEVVNGLARTRYRIVTREDPRPNRLPDEMDCQDFARHVERECFGRELFAIAVPGASTMELVRFIRSHPDRLLWRCSPRPEHGGLVEMSMESAPHHVGVWLDVDGGVVAHCHVGGVQVAKVIELEAAGWRRLVFHAWHGG